MEVESKAKLFTKKKRFSHSTILSTISLFSLFLILILFHAQPSPSFSPASKPRDSVTFLPLKDTRFANTAMEGNTWFMSSLSDTFEENESEYLYFPSEASNEMLLCIKGNDIKDGTKNSYALAYPEGLPNSTTFLKGLAFVSDTFYDYGNLWHALTAMMPFVGWSMKNGCAKPARLVLFHSGELRLREKMGLWIQNVMQANFGQVPVEEFEKGEGPYCFEKAVVMRHNVGKMGKQKKLQVSDLLRCKARELCGINPNGRVREVNVRGEPSIRLTLLMRRGSRSFKNPTAVTDVFSRECRAVDGCTLEVVQSEDLNFCDQLTNMLFMDRNSSIMEFFPKGWLELAGAGQYAYHWMADQSGMKHRGAWWDPYTEKECPEPNKQLPCLLFYKDSQVGHNETYFAEWTRTVLKQVRTSKLEQDIGSSQRYSKACQC